MSHIRIDKSKALKKWSPVLENMGVSEERLDWMSEMAEYHSINENAYVNASNVAGMGAVLNPLVGALAGTPGGIANAGSGDVGQNLLPVAMKIAAQTIGLDLVAVKPTPGPKIDLLYIDFQYDDTRSDERPQVFKLDDSGAGKNDAIKAAINLGLTTSNISLTTGGLSGGRLWNAINTTIQAAAPFSGATFVTTEPTSKTGVVEFLGFSRIDGLPMFKAYRQANTAGQFVSWVFAAGSNTFPVSGTLNAAMLKVAGVTCSTPNVTLISALEDHIPGFSANWTAGNGGSVGNYPMDRATDDDTYSGVIGPKISSKTVAVGTIEVSSAL